MYTLRRIFGLIFNLRLLPLYWIAYDYWVIKFKKDYTIVDLEVVPMVVVAVILIVMVVTRIIRLRSLPESELTPDQKTLYTRPVAGWVWVVLIGFSIVAFGMVALGNYCSSLGFDSLLSCWPHLFFTL